MDDSPGLTIRSSNGVAKLEMRWKDRDTSSVSLRDEDLSAQTDVWWNDYVEEPLSLQRFFEDLATNWKGWKGEKQWSALEHAFSLTATHDRLGHIELAVDLRSGWDASDWRTRGTLSIDAGALDEIAAQVRRFVEKGPPASG